jgi:hypothetical protein
MAAVLIVVPGHRPDLLGSAAKGYAAKHRGASEFRPDDLFRYRGSSALDKMRCQPGNTTSCVVSIATARHTTPGRRHRAVDDLTDEFSAARRPDVS